MTRSCFSSTAHQRIGAWSDRTVGVRNPRLHLSRSVVPNSPDLSPVDYLSSGGSCNSRSIRRRSRMWMNSGSNRLKSGLVWSKNIIDTAINACEKPSACLCSREGPTFQTLTVAVEQRDIWINCQPEWLKCKPNVIYACYFNKVITLPCIKCNISLVLIFPGSVETDVGRSGNVKSHLMASCVRNICAKNRQNPLLLFKVTINNVGVPFYWDTV